MPRSRPLAQGLGQARRINPPTTSSSDSELLTSAEEMTPRALRALDQPLQSSSSIDGDEEQDDDEEDEEEEDDDADFQSHYSLNASSTSGSSSDDEEGEESVNGLHRSNPSFLSNAFAPPFYNRPPTPLPPSPSLTSLLRPSFSTANSRPTTPDSSEGDTPNDTELAVAKSARTATTVPRASPKVPTYEYHGFVLYLLSSLALLIYLLWSYLPSPFLHQLGIHYYPDRWWSLAIPSFLVMTIVYIYVALASYNTGYLTLSMNSVENIVDEAANIAVVDMNRNGNGNLIGNGNGNEKEGGMARGKAAQQRAAILGKTGEVTGRPKTAAQWAAVWSEGTDAVMDVPIGGVCEVLYGSD